MELNFTVCKLTFESLGLCENSIGITINVIKCSTNVAKFNITFILNLSKYEIYCVGADIDYE